MKKEEALKELDELVNLKLSMLQLTRSMTNTPIEVRIKKAIALECQDYIKENLK